MDFKGLIVFTAPRYEFQWAGWKWTKTKAGEKIRVELFERPCKLCNDEPVIATIKLPKFARQRYEQAVRANRPVITRGAFGLTLRVDPPPPLEVRVKLPPMRWYGGLALRTCRRHRGMHWLPLEELV
jgi:hypothetical protein